MTQPEFSIIDFYDLESPYVTEYRRLLHKILNHQPERELKSVMVTSAMTAEGKSTILSFLAVTASMKKGLKTLVIDADLRLPAIHTLFGLSQAGGLAEVLAEGAIPKEVIKQTKIQGLDVLTSGRHRDNPTEIFDAEAIGNLIDELKFYYDLILVDCAPLLPVSDPMMLASRVDGTLLVIKAGSTQRELVERAARILEPDQNSVIGVVLNNMNHSLPYYFDYDHYHYDYRKPSTDENQSVPEKEQGEMAEKKSKPEDESLKDNISQK